MGCLDVFFTRDKINNIIPNIGLRDQIATIERWYPDVNLSF